MKMVMAVVPKDEAMGVLDELVANGHTATYFESKGGVLHETRIIMHIGVEEQDLESVLGIIRGYCYSSIRLAGGGDAAQDIGAEQTAQVGGAVVFVWDLESQLRF